MPKTIQTINVAPNNTASGSQGPIKTREAGAGITLLPALISILFISSLVIVIQAREIAKTQTMGRLISLQQNQLSARGVHELLRSKLALAFIQPEGHRNIPKVNGTPFEIEVSGKTWQVAFQDVEGLVDIYLASESTLNAIGLNGRKILQDRERLSADTPLGRLPNITQSLGAFGIDPELEGFVTQEATSAQITVENSPEGLAQALRSLPMNEQLFQQTKKVGVVVEGVGS